ncbi:DM13 domain-containing protein [Aquimarina sp. RZ0]|uniref:DM13 domain-containing protein n=1 Tax=Aquimarina sp. RZ0 TaxID=2607730 RepID=UPI0011F1A7A6|nr:DM13 domain-containing protein [Aquimarina sp. RZ0]KAA1244105.1 T9SS type A sorting domain-containing protein [Aquimarina sp. RZ0]
MKKITISSLILLFFQLSIHAQCTENATSFGNNDRIPDYNVSGDVSITLNAPGQGITLDLGGNFATASGPDIRAFLVNSNGLSDTELANTKIINLENIQFGLVGNLDPNTPPASQNGAKTFTIDIPEGTNIQDFDRIFFYCLEFDQFWDFGSFTPFSQANCNVLNVEENSFITTSVYPNPAKNVLHVSTNAENNSTTRIYDSNGKMLIDKNITDDPIDISSLVSGLYIVEVTSAKQKNIEKLIIN